MYSEARPPRPFRGGRRSAPSRRQFLHRAALLSRGVPSAGALLEACTRSSSVGTTPTGSLTLAAPTHPVTWPISKHNKRIVDELTPERGATLRLYNYADYIAPGVDKQFEKDYAKYDVNVRVSTFNDEDEAITKIRTGAVPYDIYFPSYVAISRLVAANLIRPLNHSYLSNIDNVWPAFKNPWYEPGVALHRAVFHLHDRYRLAGRQDQHRHRGAVESVGHVVGSEVPR
ncbi:MAG TPA: hypothetical protein VE442_00545 [Jatrophihabitans sp.]|nr:hypothetical protein [Jatrophihabitans sp.]